MLINSLELATSLAPVIIGAPPSSTSKFSSARRLFANGTRDYHGPPRPKPSKARTTVKQKHKAHSEVIPINSWSPTPPGPPRRSTHSRPKNDSAQDMGNIGTNEDDNASLPIKHHVVLSSSSSASSMSPSPPSYATKKKDRGNTSQKQTKTAPTPGLLIKKEAGGVVTRAKKVPVSREKETVQKGARPVPRPLHLASRGPKVTIAVSSPPSNVPTTTTSTMQLPPTLPTVPTSSKASSSKDLTAEELAYVAKRSAEIAEGMLVTPFGAPPLKKTRIVPLAAEPLPTRPPSVNTEHAGTVQFTHPSSRPPPRAAP